MINISPEAAKQIAISIEQSNAADLALRIAVERRVDGSFHYLMGFDENIMDSDEVIETESVKLVVDETSAKMAKGMLIDYVDIDGSMQFVFMNPNDPAYKQPQA